MLKLSSTTRVGPDIRTVSLDIPRGGGESSSFKPLPSLDMREFRLTKVNSENGRVKRRDEAMYSASTEFT